MSTLRTVLATLVATALLALATAAVVVWAGWYPTGATRQHWQSVYALLELTMRQSVRLRASEVEVPPLDDPRLLARGAACYRDKCVQCHGAPGVAQGDIGRSMQPLPGPLVDATQRWTTAQIYWITRHGIRMSGMPAWEFRIADEDIWAITGFVERLPRLSPADYAAATSSGAAYFKLASAEGVDFARCGLAPALLNAVPARPPSIERGRLALTQYACSACHTIPGVVGSSPQVGPPLAGLARRTVIAGRLANTQDNLVRWVRHPKLIDPQTAMPDLEVSEPDARDMAAYLATLD